MKSIPHSGRTSVYYTFIMEVTPRDLIILLTFSCRLRIPISRSLTMCHYKKKASSLFVILLARLRFSAEELLL